MESLANSGYNSGTSRNRKKGYLMVVRNQAEADYVKRLQILRSARGTLHLTGGTTALFAERASGVPIDLSTDDVPETPPPSLKPRAASRAVRDKGPDPNGRTRGK